MSDQIKKFKEKEVKGKLEAWKAKGKQFYSYEHANIIPISYEIDWDAETFDLIYTTPDGERESYTRKIEFIEDRIKCFSAPKIDVDEEESDEFTEQEEAENLQEQFKKHKELKIIDNELKPKIMTPTGTTMETDELTVKELRSKLFSTIKNLLDKKISPEEAKSIAIVGQTIINSVKLEMDYKMLEKKDREVKFLD